MSLSVRSSARFGTTHQKNSYFCEFAMYNNNPHSFKGQIISECPYEKIVYPKIATEKISEISVLASKERSNQKLY